MYDNLEKFYLDNHYELIEDTSDGSLRPGKSFTKDVEACIEKFRSFYRTTNKTTFSEEELMIVINDVDANTRSQNLRVMREFGFINEIEVQDCKNDKFEFTDLFVEFALSDKATGVYILDELYHITCLGDFSMYFNLLICTLREAALCGQVILFPDSIDKFKSVVSSLDKRNEYRKRVFDIYGYRGRNNQITDDTYSPNLSYMSRAELENLGLLKKPKDKKIDGMECLLLTTNGHHLLQTLDKNLISNKSDTIVPSNTVKQLVFRTSLDTGYKHNRIVFGAPGTGKSFQIDKEKKALLGLDNEVNYERVTFHPDYSYANFVGTYKPVMTNNQNSIALDENGKYVLSILNDKSKTAQEKYDLLFDKFKDEGLTRLPVLLGLYTDESFKTRKLDGSDAANDNIVEKNHGKAIRKYVKLINGHEKANDIAYEYVPGPFMRVYVNALKSARTSDPKPYLLIIEEINRANVAAVFGDIFQLLDRDEDGVSEYPVQASEDIKKYLSRELGGNPEDYNKIKIPNNMFIWATMNSADQGVFPMDTAFKRRWDFTYIGIDDNDADIRGKYVILGNGTSQKVLFGRLAEASAVRLNKAF